jgi:hypothetical protein
VPNDADCRTVCARWLVRQERFGEALQHLQFVTSTNPDILEARILLMAAAVKQSRGTHVAAIAHGILDRFPGDPDARAWR